MTKILNNCANEFIIENDERSNVDNISSKYSKFVLAYG